MQFLYDGRFSSKAGKVGAPIVEDRSTTNYKRLSLYAEAPREDVSLEDFERLAVDRLRGEPDDGIFTSFRPHQTD